MKLEKTAELLNHLTDQGVPPALRKLHQAAIDEIEPVIRGQYTPHFNALDPATQEGLAMLAGDAADLVKAIGKTLQHGIDSNFTVDGRSNRDELHKQIAWLEVTVQMLTKNGTINQRTLHEYAAEKVEMYRDPRNHKLLHHLKRL